MAKKHNNATKIIKKNLTENLNTYKQMEQNQNYWTNLKIHIGIILFSLIVYIINVPLGAFMLGIGLGGFIRSTIR